MKITWYGQASFGIESEAGILIVTDPYDPEKAGFKPFTEPADIVVKSSSNDGFHDNDHLDPKKEMAAVIDALPVALEGGETLSHGITFKAIETMEHMDHPYRDPVQLSMDCPSMAAKSSGDLSHRQAHLDHARQAAPLFKREVVVSRSHSDPGYTGCRTWFENLGYLWRAVDHEGEVLESFVTKRRDKKAALKFLKQ